METYTMAAVPVSNKALSISLSLSLSFSHIDVMTGRESALGATTVTVFLAGEQQSRKLILDIPSLYDRDGSLKLDFSHFCPAVKNHGIRWPRTAPTAQT